MQISKKRTFIIPHKSNKNPYIGTSALMLYTSQLQNLTFTKESSSANVTVNWGDGKSTVYSSSQTNLTHTYPSKGYYVLQISDDITSFTIKGSSQIAWFYSFGYKITSIPDAAFQSSRASGIDIELQEGYICDIPNVTSIGSYALDSLCNTKKVSFGKMTRLSGQMFYAGGLSKTEIIYIDNLTSIDTSECFTGWAQARKLTKVYIRNKTCQQIKSMSNFPWCLISQSQYVYDNCKFYGFDGYVTCDGTIHLN